MRVVRHHQSEDHLADPQEEDLIFLSYSTNDKRLAGEIKDGLEAFGFSAFLAHEDLVPSEEWKVRIRAEISRCNTFVPIISQNFRSSDWTDQEVGYALSRSPSCSILSLLIPPAVAPHGFLKDFQALKVNEQYIMVTCREVALALNKDLSQPGLARKSRIIDKFVSSNSFAHAKRNFSVLSDFASFSREEMDRILLASVTNKQIYWPQELRGILNELVSRHGQVASPELRDRFMTKFNS